MWALLKAVLIKVAAIKAILQLLKGLGSLGIFIPIALLLSTFGWPVLLVVAVLALPVLLVLFVLGLPLILVFVVGSVMLTILGTVLAAALPLLKLFVFVILPLVMVFFVSRWVWRLLFGKDNGDAEIRPATGDAL